MPSNRPSHDGRPTDYEQITGDPVRPVELKRTFPAMELNTLVSGC